MIRLLRATIGLFLLPTLSLHADGGPRRSSRPHIERAVDYLSNEVPRWSREHHCFSCHNNGDAARALIAAKRVGIEVPERSLADTLAWLGKPERWEKNGGDGPSNDRILARLQFTMALAKASEAKLVVDRAPLKKAATELAKDQNDDGSWRIGDSELIGAPATYGPVLATLLARDTLAMADAKAFQTAIQRAEGWLKKRPINNVPDAAVALWLSNTIPDRDGQDTHANEAFALLSRAQGKDGGFSPFVDSPSEPFDTALVILALMKQIHTHEEWQPLIDRGVDYLVTCQEADGGWPATTRPAGALSYAERISTCGWVVQALLAAESRDRK